jgi:hypothetical protein
VGTRWTIVPSRCSRACRGRPDAIREGCGSPSPTLPTRGSAPPIFRGPPAGMALYAMQPRSPSWRSLTGLELRRNAAEVSPLAAYTIKVNRREVARRREHPKGAARSRLALTHSLLRRDCALRGYS